MIDEEPKACRYRQAFFAARWAMFDSNWDLINGADAHGIEVLNQSSVVNLIEALVRYFKHHDRTPGDDCGICPNQGVLHELHRTGTLLLLEFPGHYRNCDVHVRRRDGGVYTPPTPDLVPEAMKIFETDLQALWPGAEAVDVAAFALWKINWVHPFKNGNGRTARAFAYACVCLKYGDMLPGSVTMIDLITQTRQRYEAALMHADTTFAQTGAADLLPLRTYVDDLIRQQLFSALNAGAQAAAANSG